MGESDGTSTKRKKVVELILDKKSMISLEVVLKGKDLVKVGFENVRSLETFRPTDVLQRGQLMVLVREAHLPPKIGTTYVRVTVGKQQCNTHVVHKCRSPKWNDRLLYTLPRTHDEATGEPKMLCFELIRHHDVLADEVVGP